MRKKTHLFQRKIIPLKIFSLIDSILGGDLSDLYQSIFNDCATAGKFLAFTLDNGGSLGVTGKRWALDCLNR